eukprot:scaffold30249_cov17-Tisochrysis_lutea.AAC.1
MWQGAPAATAHPPLLVLPSLLLGDDAAAASAARLPFSLITVLADQQGTERGLVLDGARPGTGGGPDLAFSRALDNEESRWNDKCDGMQCTPSRQRSQQWKAIM